jgi:hypothetical protein
MRPTGISIGKAFLVGLLVAGWGCGGLASKLVPTEGIVTLDGVPFAGAMVTFHPDGEQGHVATGLTATDGTFQLETYASADGVLPGNYKVTVTKTDAVAPPPAGNDPAKHKEWMMKAMFNRPAKKAREASVPKEYADAAKTPLRVRVPYEGPVKLELKKAGA